MKRVILVLILLLSIVGTAQERRDMKLKETTIFLPSQNGFFHGATLYLNGHTAEMATGTRVSFIRIIGPGKLNLRQGTFFYIREQPKEDVEVEILPRREVVLDSTKLAKRLHEN